MSSLAKQLDSLRAKTEILDSRVNEKRQATVLFDPKEAGKIDIDQLQTIALEGFHNLAQIHPELNPHKVLLTENKNVDRLKLTESANRSLSEQLKSLIRGLSQNLLNTNTLRVLEYLLRNYQVYQFEGEYLVIAFFAYHATPQYVKLIQNVDISQKTNRLHFLNPNSLTGQLINREFMVRQFSLDTSLIDSYRQIVVECYQDKHAITDTVFVPSALRAQQVRSPATAFLVSVISECLSTVNKKQQEGLRLISLKFVRDLLQHRVDSEGFSAIILLLTDLVTQKQITDPILQTITADISRVFLSSLYKDRESLKPVLAKFYLYSFQHLLDLSFTSSISTICTEHLSAAILGSKARLVNLAVKICEQVGKEGGKDKEVVAFFEKVLKTIYVGDVYLNENRHNLLTFIIVLFRGLKPGSKSAKESLAILKSVFGQDYYEAISLFLRTEGIPADEKKAAEHEVSDSVIHQMVSLNGISQMSLVTALSHPSPDVQKEAIKILLKNPTPNPALVAPIINRISTLSEISLITQLLQFPLRDLPLTPPQEDVLFQKYLEVVDAQVKSQIKLIAGTHDRLKSMLDILEVFIGNSKSFKNKDISLDLFIQTISTICKFISATSIKINPDLFVGALLSQRLFGHLSESLKSILRADSRVARQLFDAFSMHFNASLANLNLQQFVDGIHVAADFRTFSSELGFCPKDQSTFVKLVLILFLAEEKLIDTSLLAEISQILSALNELDLSGVEDLDNTILILFLKGFRNEELKNGYFLKILQTLRFSTKSHSGPGQNFIKAILKRLLSHKFEFESGAFSMFPEADLKILKDVLSDQQSNMVTFLKSFISHCVTSPELYYECTQFCKIIYGTKLNSATLSASLPDIASKISASGEGRHNLLKALFELYCQGTTERSTLLENTFVRIRSFVQTPFSYLQDKSAYKGFINLLEIYLESNFKYPQFVSETVLEPSLLVDLTNHVLSKHHEGLITALCILIQGQVERKDSSVKSTASLLHCYRALYKTLNSKKIKNEDTEVKVILTLDAIIAYLSSLPQVKLCQDTSVIKSKIVKLTLGGANYDTTEENKIHKFIVDPNTFFSGDVYQNLQARAVEAVKKLVQTKSSRLLQDSEEASLPQFQLIKAAIQYLVHPNRLLKKESEDFVRALLLSFSEGLESVKEQLTKPAQQRSIVDIHETTMKEGGIWTTLCHEIDYLILELLQIVSKQFGSKKLKVCSEILYFWLLLVERTKSNSLFKLLSRIYEKTKSGKKVLPLSDPEVFYYTKLLRSISITVFGQDNFDSLVYILITVYLSISSSLPKPLHFVHFSDYLLSLSLYSPSNAEDPKAATLWAINTLSSGIDNLKGFLPSGLKALAKLPKSKVIRSLLRRSDPFDSNSSTGNEKIRSLRLALVYLAFMGRCLAERRFVKRIQDSIADSGPQSALMQALKDLLLRALYFQGEFETFEQAVNSKGQGKKQSVSVLLAKIRRVCGLDVKSISQLIPLELYPESVAEGLVGEIRDFGSLQRMSSAMLDRIDSSKVNDTFMENFTLAMERFTSQGQLLLEDQGKSNSMRKFVQSMFVSLGLLQKKHPKKVQDIVSSRFETLIEIAVKQTNPIVKMACLGSLAMFAKGLTDVFLGSLNEFVAIFESLVLDIIGHRDESLLAKLQSLSVFANCKKLFPTKKNLAHKDPSYSNIDLPVSWLKCLSDLFTSLGSMLDPYLTRILYYVFTLDTFTGELKSLVHSTLTTITSTCAPRLLIAPLTSMVDSISKQIYPSKSLQTVIFATQAVIGKVEREEFADVQDKVFNLIREIVKTTVARGSAEVQLVGGYKVTLQSAIELITTFALKCSEKIFRPHFESLIKWSKLVHEYDAESDELMEKKIAMLQILNSLIGKLGRFGINYYGHVFDYFVGFMSHCEDKLKHLSSGGETGKRASSAPSARFIEIHGLIMHSLKLLFSNDRKGFIDPLKFEQLIKPLASQVALPGLSENFPLYVETVIAPVIVELAETVSDDFMWKTIVHQVCSHLRTAKVLVRRAVAITMSALVTKLAERFMSVLSDFLPHLALILDDEEPAVSSLGKTIVKQLEQFSSEDILTMLKNSV
jgi:hypothetical protein